MKDVQVILLNGPTCSGKSSLARCLQDRLSAPYSVMGIDTFVAMLPLRYSVAPCPEDRLMVITQLRYGFHAAVAAMVGQGNRVIVDTVRAEASWLDEWLVAFAPFSVLFVGVFARLEDLVRREAERCRFDDVAGTAERHFRTVHVDDVYDVRIDTSEQSLEESADEVMAFLQSGREPKAFDELRKRRIGPKLPA